VFWAVAYDTEYAMVDREDDRKIGIRTSAITFGRHDVTAVMICHAMFLLILAWIGWRYAPGIYFFFGGLLLAAGLAATHYQMIRDRDPESCFRAFQNNNWIGAAVFAGLAASFRFP
ncbi:MAG: UbiA family prenyltransferase, partial [Burkholderiales bacterium]